MEVDGPGTVAFPNLEILGMIDRLQTLPFLVMRATSSMMNCERIDRCGVDGQSAKDS